MTQSPQIFDRRLLCLRRARCFGDKSQADFLLEHVAREITDRLEATNRQFENAIAYNAAGGALAAAIHASGKADHVVTADLCPSQAPAGGDVAVVYDEEALPFGGAGIGLIVSALMMHWANDLPGALVQARRALRPDGLFLGALFGADTLHELRSAFLAADAELSGGAGPRIAPFADVRDLGSLMQRAGFALPVVDADRLTVRYNSAFDLMADLRAMAATNVMAARTRHTGRQLFSRMAEIYHDTYAHADGRIPATFNIVYLSGWAPHDSQQQPLKPGSARQRLADALGTTEHKI
jgi:SAM-dependent methyltransferase